MKRVRLRQVKEGKERLRLLELVFSHSSSNLASVTSLLLSMS